MQDYLKHVSTVDNSYWEQIDQAIKKLKTLPDQEIKLILHQSRNNQLILDYLEIYGVDNEALFSYPLNSFRDYFLGELGVDRRLSDIVAQKLEQIYKERLGMYAPDALGFSETEQSSLGIHFPTVLALYDKLKNSFKTYLSTVSTLAQAKATPKLRTSLLKLPDSNRRLSPLKTKSIGRGYGTSTLAHSKNACARKPSGNAFGSSRKVDEKR